jgi:hypothetical protein
LYAVLALAALAQGTVAGPRAVPRDGVITITDYGFREWGPELVHYRLDERELPGLVAVYDEADKPIPSQVVQTPQGRLLEFVAAVKKGGTARYRVVSVRSEPGLPPSTLVHRATDAGVEVGNEYFSLLLPSPGVVAFKMPAAASELPAPILRWKQAGQAWVGGARFVTERKATSVTFTCVEQGPVSVVYRARYTFEPKGEYVWQVRVNPGVPVAHITEDFNFGEITEGKDFLLLGLGEGWTPAQIGWMAAGGDRYTTVVEPLAPYVEKRIKEGNKPVSNVSSSPPPAPIAPVANYVLLDKVTATGTWGPKGGVELRAPGAGGTTISISATPYFAGSWRRALAMTVWQDPARGVQMALPISVRPIRWYSELSDDQSPFCTHEHDSELPASYGRRAWALGFGIEDAALALWPDFAASLKTADYQGKITDPAVKTRCILGYIGLDRYKDWILDWPEDAKKAAYPHAYFTKETAARLKAALDQHPDKDLLSPLYLMNGKKESAIASANSFVGYFKNPYVNEWQVFGLTSYIAAYSDHRAIFADDALSCPDLPADLRQQVRRTLALYAYLCAEPDRNPRGAGMHLGNPNMPIGRTEALTEFATLLPDHPQYDYWMQQMKDYTAFKLASMTDPGGAWFEPPTYQMYGPTRSLALGQLLLRNAGVADLAKEGWHAKCMEYDANLTMPDVRYKGWRILPGMGNSGNTLEAVFGMAAGVVEGVDKREAGFFKSMHLLNSGNGKVSGGGEGTGYTPLYQPDIPETPRPLTTTFIPGYGVAFRAHYGTPDETAMLLRCGFNKSHWDMDTNNTILYGKGAPLSPGTGYQYYYGPAMENNAIYHNRVKVGKPDAAEPFGRAEDYILDYGFGANADYAVGHEYYPPEYFDDGKGEMEWHRHALFLKSAQPAGANYFVLRDTFPGGAGRQTWWHWLNLDGPEMIKQDGNIVEMATKYGAGTWFWFTRPMPGKVVRTFDYGFQPNYHQLAFGKGLGVPTTPDKETKTIYQLAGAPGQDYFYVAFPRKDGEAAPKVAQLADGVLKVVTAEATDYVFVSDTPQTVNVENVVFTGKAGAVRVFPDRVVFCMNSGAGQIGYRGYVLVGNGPFEVTVAKKKLRKKVVPVDGGYAKTIVTQNLGQGITVTGEGPFTAKLDGENIRIHTSGRARVLQVTRPSFIWMPQYFLDGREWMAFWTDYAGSRWGAMKNSALISVSTLDGEHDLLLRNRVYNPVWQRQFTPMCGAGQ